MEAEPTAMTPPPTGPDARVVQFVVNVQPFGRKVIYNSQMIELNEWAPGDQLRGNISFAVSEQVDVRGLEVLYQGFGMSRTEPAKPAAAAVGGATQQLKQQNPQQQPPQTAAAKEQVEEVFLNEVQSVLGFGPNTQPISFQRGSHNVSFSFTLPRSIPSTFEGRHGSIRYSLKATLITTKGSVQADVPFAVHSYLMPRQFLTYLRPSEFSLTRNYKGSGMKVFSSGPVGAKFAIGKMLYAAGEHIVINGMVANRAPVSVYAIEARLVQHIVYARSNGKRIDEHNSVSHVRDDKPVVNGEARKWAEVHLAIPLECTASYLQGSQLIEIFYELVFEVSVRHNKHLTAALPVVVGVKEPLPALNTLTPDEQQLLVAKLTGRLDPRVTAGLRPPSTTPLRAEVHLPSAAATPSGSVVGTVTRPFGAGASGAPHTHAQDLALRMQRLAAGGESVDSAYARADSQPNGQASPVEFGGSVNANGPRLVQHQVQINSGGGAPVADASNRDVYFNAAEFQAEISGGGQGGLVNGGTGSKDPDEEAIERQAELF